MRLKWLKAQSNQSLRKQLKEKKIKKRNLKRQFDKLKKAVFNYQTMSLLTVKKMNLLTSKLQLWDLMTADEKQKEN